MFDLVVASKERHDRFIQRVAASREVWGLKSADGWVCSASAVEATEDRSVMPFWSDRAYAKQCAKEEWSHYEATPIPLDLFLERWLPGIADDGRLVGTNWNAHLCGRETEPLELKQEIEKQLKSTAE
jgi:hypothetical protein